MPLGLLRRAPKDPHLEVLPSGWLLTMGGHWTPDSEKLQAKQAAFKQGVLLWWKSVWFVWFVWFCGKVFLWKSISRMLEFVVQPRFFSFGRVGKVVGVLYVGIISRMLDFLLFSF